MTRRPGHYRVRGRKVGPACHRPGRMRNSPWVTEPAEFQTHSPTRALPSSPGYKVFTDEFDEIIDAGSLYERGELIRLRTLLDNHIGKLSNIVGRLSSRLQRRLLAKQDRGWEFDLEEGLLDTSRLARVVINPLNTLSFKREKEIKLRDTVVSCLIDNSGSMRGRPILLAAITADMMARTLERCGVKVRNSGLYHPRLEGWPRACALAGKRAAFAAGPAQ